MTKDTKIRLELSVQPSTIAYLEMLKEQMKVGSYAEVLRTLLAHSRKNEDGDVILSFPALP